MSQRRFAILRADIGREMDNLRRLVAEAREWQPGLAGWPETVRVRTSGGILHDFYCGVERIFRHIAVNISTKIYPAVQTGTSSYCSAWQQTSRLCDPPC
jgi:hypothetical protein